MEQKITVNLDNLTIGDLEDLESGKLAIMMPVFDGVVKVEGVPDNKQPEALRALPWKMLVEIAEAIKAAVEAESNPETGEKN